MNPDVSIKSLTGLSGGYQSKDCLQLDNALKDCGDGFVLDSSTNFCYKTLEVATKVMIEDVFAIKIICKNNYYET